MDTKSTSFSGSKIFSPDSPEVSTIVFKKHPKFCSSFACPAAMQSLYCAGVNV